MGCCTRCCGLIVLVLAVLIGWLNMQKHPIGYVFAAVFTLQGLGKPQTELVPDDLTPQPRPAEEIFFDLPSGDKMPAIGIGMCCRPTAYDAVSVHRTILWYLLQGGRHIDTASVYMNHEAIALGIKDAIARGVPRKEIFVTTKVWPGHYGYNESIQRGREMVKELGLEYIDLVLLHVPIQIQPALLGKYYLGKLLGGSAVDAKLGSDPTVQQLRLEAWKGLSTLWKEGLIRNLGVSNFNIEHMKEVQDLKLAPISANQMQFHPWAPDWLKAIKAYCQENNIVVTGYFSLGGFDNKDKTTNLDALTEVSKVHGRRTAQILLRWSLQKNVAIIPGTGNPKHMVDNLGTYGFSLSDEDMKKLDGMGSLPISENFMFFEF
mmetsp:Transcript_30835/g.70742  ORF Transcript_30835/g.70742 Transcript_30835/m.70742 type:complete len:376 (-) Transcript_30835:50-1177(-)